MNRRGFITTLLAGAVLDPERLLWTPGKKLISIPPAMPYTPLVPLTKEDMHKMIKLMRIQPAINGYYVVLLPNWIKIN
jgi:hypothetical protein